MNGYSFQCDVKLCTSYFVPSTHSVHSKNNMNLTISLHKSNH